MAGLGEVVSITVGDWPDPDVRVGGAVYAGTSVTLLVIKYAGGALAVPHW